MSFFDRPFQRNLQANIQIKLVVLHLVVYKHEQCSSAPAPAHWESIITVYHCIITFCGAGADTEVVIAYMGPTNHPTQY